MLGGEEDVDGDDRGGDDHIGDGDDGNTTSCQLFVRKVTKNKSFMIMIDYGELVVMMVMIVLTGTFADCNQMTIIMITVIVVMKSVVVVMKMYLSMILALRIDRSGKMREPNSRRKLKTKLRYCNISRWEVTFTK